MHNSERLALVITHADTHKSLLNIPLLEVGFGVDASDWIVLSLQGWQAAAGADPVIWKALERKLLIGFYTTQPDLIAVVGHARGRHAVCAAETAKSEAGRVLRRVRSLHLPSSVLGFLTDEQQRLLDFIEPDEGRSYASARPTESLERLDPARARDPWR